MKFGISGLKFFMSNGGGVSLTSGSFDATGFFILSYNGFSLSYDGRALAVRPVHE